MDFYRSLLRFGVGGIVIIVMIGVALAPIVVVAMHVIIICCIVFTVGVLGLWLIKTVRDVVGWRKRNLRRDPRRR